MNIFNFDTEQLKSLNAIYTATEINQQPATWLKTIKQIKDMKNEIKTFIDEVVKAEDFDIVFTGAGTSEFVGNALYSELNIKFKHRVHSYASTDITAMPLNYISKDKPTLLVSFGRSGNSPESLGAVDSAEAVSDKIYNLFITCNKNGQLSKRAESSKKCLAINLTDETHDLSFAMTSSFTNMYLAAYLCFNIDEVDEKAERLTDLIEASKNLLENDYKYFLDITNKYDYKRIVYLGSNTLKGISQESALKMLELTAGKVVTMFDTPLGFRHGPKSIVDDETLTVVYLSDNEYTRRYEIDLIKEMSVQRKKNKILAISNTDASDVKDLVDFYYEFKTSEKSNIELGIAYVICAHLLSLYKSLSLDITPDNPCPSGEVNRVVKGVTLYPFK